MYVLRPFLIIIISITKIITWTRHMCHFFWTLFYDISVYKEPRDVTLTIVHYWCSSGQLAKVRYSKCKFSETNFILPSILNKKSKFSKFEKEKKKKIQKKNVYKSQFKKLYIQKIYISKKIKSFFWHSFYFIYIYIFLNTWFFKI